MRLRFGSFCLDTLRRELTREGQPVHLTPKAFQLLEHLAAQKPRAVSQQDLYDRLWPDKVVDASSLHKLIHEIRRALTDTEQAIVRTVYGHGFAFAADAVALEAAEPGRCRIEIGTQVFELRQGETVVGRAHDAAVRIDAASVSRHHARLVVDSAACTVEDLGSKNGTSVKGRRIHAITPLSDGDLITFGRVAVLFRILPELNSTDTSF